jgi:SAM-dependent methyltransferase
MILNKNRLRINKELDTIERRRFFSPAIYGLYKTVLPEILKYVNGKFIDIGCGDMPYRDLIMNRVHQYDSVDIERRIPDVKFVADVQDMDIIKNKSYDSGICLEVLEHTQNFFQALREIHRILKVDAILIFSVPHLSRLHEEPNDFYRYTKHGLKFLFDETDFKTLKITPYGGLFSFLGHQVSTFFLCSCWHIPIIKNIVFFINKWFCVKSCYLLDKIFDKKKIFALGYVCVVQGN